MGKDKVSCIVKIIENYREKKVDSILEDKENTEKVKKEKLVEELHRVRFYYNLWDKFSSGFVLGFLSGFVVLMVGCAESIVTKSDASSLKDVPSFIIGFFIIILICQWLFVCMANIYYEKMEVVKTELEKIK